MATCVFSKNKDINKVVLRYIRKGWRVEPRGRNKYKLFYPGSNQDFVNIPFTPSNHRALDDFLSHIRKVEARVRARSSPENSPTGGLSYVPSSLATASPSLKA